MRLSLLAILFLALPACTRHSRRSHHHHGQYTHHHGSHCHRAPRRSLATVAIEVVATGVIHAIETLDRPSKRPLRHRPRHRIAMVRTDRPRTPSLEGHVGVQVVLERTDAATLQGTLTAHDGVYAYLTDDAGIRHKVPSVVIKSFRTI